VRLNARHNLFDGQVGTLAPAAHQLDELFFFSFLHAYLKSG
jgi:hypothetical protein